MNGMPMTPPPGDPLGVAIVVIGTLLTALAFVFAVRVSIAPGERDPHHPKYLVLKDDR